MLPIARQQFEGMLCLFIEMYVLAGQLNLPPPHPRSSRFREAYCGPERMGTGPKSAGSSEIEVATSAGTEAYLRSELPAWYWRWAR
jgi:hypothetical protein